MWMAPVCVRLRSALARDSWIDWIRSSPTCQMSTSATNSGQTPPETSSGPSGRPSSETRVAICTIVGPSSSSSPSPSPSSSASASFFLVGSQSAEGAGCCRRVSTKSRVASGDHRSAPFSLNTRSVGKPCSLASAPATTSELSLSSSAPSSSSLSSGRGSSTKGPEPSETAGQSRTAFTRSVSSSSSFPLSTANASKAGSTSSSGSPPQVRRA